MNASIEKYSDSKVAILVVSCDGYRDLWEPFFHCFFKYWPDCPYTVYLGSNTKSYPDDRVQSITVGEDLDYSSNLLAMLDRIKEDWVIFWIEDRVISAPVNTDRISRLLNRAITEKAAFLKLISSHPFAFTNGYDEMGEITPGNKYRVCMTVALWNKQYLQELLLPGESAWEIERNGSVRSSNLPTKFLSISYKTRNNPPITDTHLIIKGRLLRDAKPFLTRENMLKQLKGRVQQTLRSYLYVRLYLLFKGLVAQFTNAFRKQGS